YLSSLFATLLRFFCNATSPTEIYTLSLHDALPIWVVDLSRVDVPHQADFTQPTLNAFLARGRTAWTSVRERLTELLTDEAYRPRSEEHTSELQSLTNLVCRLLLEKKKNEKSKPLHH